MSPARPEQAPGSVRPTLVRPGENPALDAALARLRQNEAAPAHGAGAAAGAVAGAGAGAGPRRRRGSGWLLVGLSALAITGTVIVMVLAVLGGREPAPAAVESGRIAPSAAAVPSPPAALPSSRVSASASAAAPSAAPAASAPGSMRAWQPSSAAPAASAAPAPAPMRASQPVDPALNE